MKATSLNSLKVIKKSPITEYSVTISTTNNELSNLQRLISKRDVEVYLPQSEEQKVGEH